MPRAMPVGQSGATEPCWWMDKMVKVMTPATEVTNVEARAAGATSAGRLPEPMPDWAQGGISTVYAIGDAWAPATIAAAVWAGRRYAEELDAPVRS